MAFFTVPVHGGEEASAAINAFLFSDLAGLSWAELMPRAVVPLGAELWKANP